MVQINVRYQGGLRCEAVHGPSGTTYVTDAPVDNHGKGESFSPTDLVATALATCIPTIMGIVAEREKIDLTRTPNQRDEGDVGAATPTDCEADDPDRHAGGPDRATEGQVGKGCAYLPGAPDAAGKRGDAH